MYNLALLSDKVKISPENFNVDITDALTEQIEIKYVNKVLLDVGLCVCMYDFVEVGDPYVYPSEGSCHQHIKFRMVVFRPFVGEMLVGRIVSCMREGLRVSLEFFDEILIPSHLLQHPSEYDEVRGLWLWKYDDSESEFSMEVGDDIRFRVRTLNFTRLTSTAKGMQAITTMETHTQGSIVPPPALQRAPSADLPTAGEEPPRLRRRSSSSVGVAEDAHPSAMQIIGCINEDGLGLISWWQ